MHRVQHAVGNGRGAGNGDDGAALGNLLRLTVFNPDNALQARTSQVLSDVVGDQRALLANGTEQQQDRAVLTLSYLGAAAEDDLAARAPDGAMALFERLAFLGRRGGG